VSLLNLYGLIVVVACVLAASIVLWGVITYNLFVRLRNRCINQWSQIDIQLKRRYELIPELVRIVRGYASHEKELFERITAARTEAINAGALSDRARAEGAIDGTVKSLFAVAEDYPDLRADENFLDLQKELKKTEEKIRFARQFYNDTVMRYNVAIDTFPNLVLAFIFRFEAEDFFELNH
jgi:LemA protein